MNVLTPILNPIKNMVIYIADKIKPPPWIIEEQRLAIQSLEEAQQYYDAIRDKNRVVNRLTKEHELDRRRNNYSERVAKAMGGRI